MFLKQNIDAKAGGLKKPVRNPNLDLIRCVAVLMMISAHFFLNTSFYVMDIQGAGMALAIIVRNALLACVPLFLLLTGYLCSHKQWTTGYLKGLLPTVTTYLLVCVMLLLRRVVIYHREVSLWEEILRILAFGDGSIRYAWYVEMYIGLYLLIPFLNLIYHNLSNKKEKQILLGVFLFLTMAPQCFNDIDWLTPGFFRQLNLSTEFQKILPSWWSRLWPLTYFFLGAYIREYDIKLPRWKNIALLTASILVFGLFEFYRCWGGKFRELGSSSLGGLPATINGVLLFLFLLHLDLSRLPGMLISLMKWISTLSFGIYLCSDLSDSMVYPHFNQLPISFTLKYICLPLVALNSFLIALACSQLIAWVQKFLFWAAGRCKVRKSNL